MVIPHVLESSGRITSAPYCFDTDLHMTYTPGLGGTSPGGGATVDLYLFDDAGNPMTNSGAVVCDPCTYVFDDFKRNRTVSIDDRITNASGAFDTPVKTGFGVLVIGGADPDGVAVQGFVVNSHTGPFDLSVAPMNGLPLASEEACPLGARVYVIPHILEKQGTVPTTQFTFDTSIFANYVGGIGTVVGSGGATVDLYLYGDNGELMQNNAHEVCAPCSFPLGGLAARKASISVDDLILAQGAFDTPIKTGFGILVIGGADPEKVAVQGFVVNSHTGAFDTSIHGLEPVQIPAPSIVGVQPGVVRDAKLSVLPNPARGSLQLSYEMARAADVELAIYSPSGRRIAMIASGHAAAGVHTARWDGKDERGARVAPGVYFGRLASTDGSVASKVVVLP